MSTQSAFEFTPPITVQFRSLRQVTAASVYGCRAGLNGVASDCDVSPSELQRQLNRGQNDERKLDVDTFEEIIASTGDMRPIQYLIEKFMRSPEQVRAHAAEQLASILPAVIELAHQAGISTTAKRR